MTKKGEEKKKIARKVVIEFNEYMIDRIDKSDLKKYFDTMQSITEITEEYKKFKTQISDE